MDTLDYTFPTIPQALRAGSSLREVLRIRDNSGTEDVRWRKSEHVANFFDAFPDAAYTLNDLFFAGDKGVWRGTWNATQREQWEGIPATGRKAKWTVIIIGRFEGERLAEDWVEYDRYNLFRQLGAL